jgi:hypothetical protein
MRKVQAAKKKVAEKRFEVLAGYAFTRVIHSPIGRIRTGN